MVGVRTKTGVNVYARNLIEAKVTRFEPRLESMKGDAMSLEPSFDRWGMPVVVCVGFQGTKSVSWPSRQIDNRRGENWRSWQSHEWIEDKEEKQERNSKPLKKAEGTSKHPVKGVELARRCRCC